MENISKVIEEDIKKQNEKIELLIHQKGNSNIFSLLNDISDMKDEVKNKKKDIITEFNSFIIKSKGSHIDSIGTFKFEDESIYHKGSNSEIEIDEICRNDTQFLRVIESKERRRKAESIISLLKENIDIIEEDFSTLVCQYDDSGESFYLKRNKVYTPSDGIIDISESPMEKVRNVERIIKYSDEITKLLNKAKQELLQQKIKLRDIHSDIMSIIKKGSKNDTKEKSSPDGDLIDEINHIRDEKHILFGRRKYNFGVDVIERLQDEIEGIIEKRYNEILKLREMISEVVNFLYDSPSRLTINKDITIRDGRIYRYSSSGKASIENIINAKESICKNLKGERRDKLKSFLDKVNNIYNLIHSVKYMGGSFSDKNCRVDYIEDYVIPLEDEYYTYIYYQGEDVVINELDCSLKRASIKNPENRERIDFRHHCPDNIAQADYVPVESIKDALRKIRDNVKEQLDEISFITSDFEDEFASILVSKEI